MSLLLLALPLALAGPIDDAVQRRLDGDLPAATALLDAYAPIVPEEERATLLYQRGICAELAFHPDVAERYYRDAVALGGPGMLDARFRLALVLEAQGRDAEALREIVALDKEKGIVADDVVTLALQQGVAEVGTGRVRRGVRRIEAALAAVEGFPTHAYMRAKGRYTLASVLLREADAATLTGGERRVVRRLKKRADRIHRAEEQIAAVARLNEPEWVLAGLVELGDSYAALAGDLAAAPAPRRLTDDEEAIYRDEVGKKAAIVRAKAVHAWDEGVKLAARLGWESPRVETLRARLASLGGA